MDAAKPQSQATASQTTQTTQTGQSEVETASPANPGGLVQRAKAAPRTLTPAQVLQLQRTLGNQHVQQLLKPKAPPPATLQRKVYMGDSKTELDTSTLTNEELNKGEGPRKIQTMVADAKKHAFFKDKTELLAYAAEQTENIGYLERERTWIRLPENELLVLGENHGDTTLSHVVKAVGTQKYIYEPYTEVPTELYTSSKRMKNAINQRREQVAAKADKEDDSDEFNHDAETFFPKAVIGLAGLRDVIKDAVIDKVNKIKPEKVAAASEEYNRNAVQLLILNQAIILAAKAAKYNVSPQPFWQTHRKIFNDTAGQLRGNTALSQTKFIAAIAEGTFTFDDFIDSFKDAAAAELTKNGEAAAFDNFQTQNEDEQASKAPEARQYERMREFQMLKKIRKAKTDNYLLAGMGDVHRSHMEAILDNEGGIMTRQLNSAGGATTVHPTFVDEQKAKHTP